MPSQTKNRESQFGKRIDALPAGADGHVLELKAPVFDAAVDPAINTILGEKNHCFGCAPDNRLGLRLRFMDHPEDRTVECIFRLPRRYQGPPGYVHGGIIATILDEAMGKVNRQKKIVALTRRMSVEYLRPVPLNQKLHAVGWPVSEDGRKHNNAAEIRAPDGTVLARSEGCFIAIDPIAMFGGGVRSTD